MEENLKKIANDIRKDIIEMVYSAQSGHPGGSLSCADILTVIYHHTMNLELDESGERIDKLVMSKGHATPVYYASLASCGLIDRGLLKGFRKYDSILEGHPSNKIPGVDSSSGSLGQGFSIANGFAIAKKTSNKQGNVYCIIGDGELEEGQIWEAFMTMNKLKLNNVIPIIDNNGYQIDGDIRTVKSVDKIAEKVQSFGIDTITIDGHNIHHIISAINKVKAAKIPTCIIAKTIKGKGVSYMENQYMWHGKALNPTEYEKAMLELEEAGI